jgi:hypothetical protein
MEDSEAAGRLEVEHDAALAPVVHDERVRDVGVGQAG